MRKQIDHTNMLAIDSYLLVPFLGGLLLTLWTRNVLASFPLFLIADYGVWYSFFLQDLTGTDLFHIIFTQMAVLCFGIFDAAIIILALKTPVLISWSGHELSLWKNGRINSIRAVLFNIKSILIVLILIGIEIMYAALAVIWNPRNGLLAMLVVLAIYPLVYFSYLPESYLFGDRQGLFFFTILVSFVHFTSVAIYFLVDAIIDNIISMFFVLAALVLFHMIAFVSFKLCMNSMG